MAELKKQEGNWLQKQTNRIKEYYKKTIRAPHPASDIALAVATGVFVSFQPTFFFFFPIIFALMFIVPVLRRNKIPFLLGSFVNNTFTSIITFPFAYEIGKKIMGGGISVTGQELTKMASFGMVYKQLMLGCAIVGIIAAIIAYALIFLAVTAYRKRRMKKQGKNEEAHQASKQQGKERA